MLAWTEKVLMRHPWNEAEKQAAGNSATCLFGEAAAVSGVDYDTLVERVEARLGWAGSPDFLFTGCVRLGTTEDYLVAERICRALEDVLAEIRREGGD